MVLDALRLAGGFLSVLPVRPVEAPDRRTAGLAMVLAPLAVVPLAVAAGFVAGLAQLLVLPTAVRALLVVGALALGTRAMHLDGLADTVDGLGAGWDRARALDVMRRGDVGPVGATALVVVLGLQVAGLAGLTADAATGALAVALLVCASRAVLVLVCRGAVPAARPDGLGRVVAGTVRPLGVAAGVLVLLVLGTAAGLAVSRPWWQGLLGAALAGVVVLVLVAHAVRRLGGVSGDVLGAAVEAAFATLVVGLAARP